MFSNGYFSGGGSGGQSKSSSDVKIIDGEVVYTPTDPIYIDEDNNVYLNEEKSNAYLTVKDGEIFAEKVI